MAKLDLLVTQRGRNDSEATYSVFDSRGDDGLRLCSGSAYAGSASAAAASGLHLDRLLYRRECRWRLASAQFR